MFESISYIPYQVNEKASENHYEIWNQMMFIDCKVMSIIIEKFRSGRRMSLELEAPRLRKKYYLFAWEDRGILQAIEKANLKQGDVISCYAELKYFEGKDKRMMTAWSIMPNVGYQNTIPESEKYFNLMCIKRVAQKSKPTNNKYMTKQELLMKMLG